MTRVMGGFVFTVLVAGAIAIACVMVLAGCGAAPEPTLSMPPPAPANQVVVEPPASMRIHALAVRPPSLCLDGGTCPAGLACADDGHCGVDCGNNFVCPIGWGCWNPVGTHDHDCVPECWWINQCQ